MTQTSVQFSRTQHIAGAYHLVQEKAHDGQLLPTHVPTGGTVADILTKAQLIPAFSTCRQAAGVRSYL